MKVKLLQKWELGDELVSILSPNGDKAVALATYGHKGFLVKSTQPELLNLASLSPVFQKAGADFNPIDLNLRGALFPADESWGVVFADVVHLISADSRIVRTLPVENPLQPDTFGRDRTPLRARALPSGREIAVVASSFNDGHVAKSIGLLSLGDDSARWMAEPIPLSAGDFPRLGEADLATYGAGYQPFITAIGLDAYGHLLVHSSGPMCNYYRYGMSYSVLARVSRDLRSQVIGSVEPGFGTFASDGQNFLLYRLRGKPVLDIYDLKGTLKDSLSLTPKLLGGRKKFTWNPIFDLRADQLWVADPFDGYVCHLQLE